MLPAPLRALLCALPRAILIALCLAAPPAFSAGVCDDFSARLPNVKRAMCQAAQLRVSSAKSVNGLPIYVRDVGPANAPLRVLVVGGIHGDEMSSASLALYWIGLAQGAPGNTRWRFVPALNPDGLLAQPATRVNANGVDLNRNFPTPNWARDARIYWEKTTRKDPRRWPGKAPLSEPESRFLHSEMQRFKPHVIVSIHAPYGLLDFDGPTAPPSRLGHLYLDQVGIYPGSLGNYGGVHNGMPVVTIELPSALRTPLDAEMRQMWLDLERWMGERVAQGPSLSMNGVSGVNGAHGARGAGDLLRR